MLHYQSTSFHDALYARNLLGLQPAPEFQEWLIANGLFDKSGQLLSGKGGQWLLEKAVGVD